jgi:Histidine kinase-, DNA gyrase B-, and HSP90-like ATPase
MDAASTSARRAGALTHRLLAFARRQSLDIRPNNINRLVGSMEDPLHRTLGEHIELECSLSTELWTTFTDANQLESAVLNLAINARDAMPDGGRLTIETTNVHLDEAYTSLQEDVASGDYVVIGVSDTGTGMPADVVAKAIDPFFTTKPVGDGTGLGLSMVYGFAKQTRSHLRIYSEVGHGTTIKFYLPRALQDAVDLQKPVEEAPRGQGETILVVGRRRDCAADPRRCPVGAGLRCPSGLRRASSDPHFAIRSPHQPHDVRRHAAAHQRPQVGGNCPRLAARPESAFCDRVCGERHGPRRLPRSRHGHADETLRARRSRRQGSCNDRAMTSM